MFGRNLRPLFDRPLPHLREPFLHAFSAGASFFIFLGLASSP